MNTATQTPTCEQTKNAKLQTMIKTTKQTSNTHKQVKSYHNINQTKPKKRQTNISSQKTP